MRHLTNLAQQVLKDIKDDLKTIENIRQGEYMFEEIETFLAQLRLEDLITQKDLDYIENEIFN